MLPFTGYAGIVNWYWKKASSIDRHRYYELSDYADEDTEWIKSYDHAFGPDDQLYILYEKSFLYPKIYWKYTHFRD